MVLEYRTMLRRKSRILLNVIFFFLCYLYVWTFIKPDLIYHGFGTIIPDVPLFSTGWQFLRDSLNLPGGLTVYAYGFLSQWYYYSWLGALVVVLVALCASVSFQDSIIFTLITLVRPFCTIFRPS